MNPHRTESAYHYCEQLARSHYENFPVASWLLPRPLRRPIAVIYAFARHADDLADEGEHSETERLALLREYEGKLQQCEHGAKVDDPVFIALTDVMTQHKLPSQLFHDLLSAFSQDVTKKRYRDFAELLDYCRRSANPVGRLLLHLSGNDSEENLQLSDQVCTALQLINFYQDMAQDYDENGRIYIPEEEIQRFAISERAFAEHSHEKAMVDLVIFQVERAREIMLQGAPLGRKLKGRFGLEIRLIIAGGLAVLERLAQSSADPFARPRLRKRDWLRALWRAL